MPHIRFSGRILFLTEDEDLLAKQLRGETVAIPPDSPLISNISTDEITPGWVCYYYDETLARYCLVGLRGGHIKKDTLKDAGFDVLVSGPSKGCGSSRETAPYSELMAGIRLVIAPTIEKIYRQNAENIGLLTSTDMGLIARIARGEPIAMEEFTKGRDPISAAIVQAGGLFAYNKERLAGRAVPPSVSTPPRKMTLVEKILSTKAVVDAKRGVFGVPAVKPGDAFFAKTDVRFSHEYVTPMAESLFRQGLGADARVSDPESVFAFRDHLTFLNLVMPKAHRDMGLDAQAERLKTVQEDFVSGQGIKLYGEVTRNGKPAGSEAICHNKVIEEIAMPCDLVLGTDSHTCMAGALGCFAFGVGSTDMANAWFTKDVRITVPETARFVLHGRLAKGVSAKDVMLHLLAMPFFKNGDGIGKVMEFAGDGTMALSLDERATLTNMAVEAGGFTGIVEADEVVVDYLIKERGCTREDVRLMKADEGASYVAEFHVNLAEVVPMVATPGDPRNGIPLANLTPGTRIHIAYGGSCTGGKKADMDMYAEVLSLALEKGKRVSEGVHFYLQFGSQDIRRYAEQKGYLELFSRVGAELVDPSCGACIKAGPGASSGPDEVTVSAQNRNFPGRSGPGKVYLASPYVVAASAIAGHIAGPEALLR